MFNESSSKVPPSVRSSLALRPSPLLLLGAALAALAVFFVLGSPPAAAQDPPLSKNANLSGLTASYAYGNSQTFTAMALSPAFNSGTTNYYPGGPRRAMCPSTSPTSR